MITVSTTAVYSSLISCYFCIELQNSPKNLLSGRTRKMKNIKSVKHKFRLVRDGSSRVSSFVIGGLPAQAESGYHLLIGGLYKE
jgi:hypothetical protein